MILDTKRKFYELYRIGALGNMAATWYDPALVPLGAKVMLRSTTRSNAHLRIVDGREARRVMRIPPLGGIMATELAPDHLATLQGCLFDFPGRGLMLECYHPYQGRVLRHREAMLEFKTYEGLHARALLQANVDPHTLADFESILREYPYHVIEFTSYKVRVGDFVPPRNTLVWEVRKY